MRVWQLLCQQLIENDTEGVNIRLERVRVWLVHSDHLWSHPENRPCWLVLPGRSRPSNFRRCQAEVANLDSQVVMQKDVVRLQVAMNDALSVKIVHALCYLPSDIDECVQFELRLINVNMLIQAAAFAPLSYDS